MFVESGEMIEARSQIALSKDASRMCVGKSESFQLRGFCTEDHKGHKGTELMVGPGLC